MTREEVSVSPSQVIIWFKGSLMPMVLYSYSSNWFYSIQAFLLVLVLQEPSSQFRVAAMQASAEHVRCSGSMVECSDQMAEEELSMESETSRRFVQAVKHLSPGAMGADSPVCGYGRRGQPYQGSCLPPPSNNYHRGCLSIYRCRS